MTMSDSNNPYTAPQSDVDNNLTARSSIPKVIGIISIILGGLGAVSGIFGLGSMALMGDAMNLDALGMSSTYLIGSSVVTILTSIWAIFIGIKLLKYSDTGRVHFNIYTVVTIIISIVTFFYTKSMMDNMFKDMSPEMAAAAGSASTFSSLGAFIAPILLIIVALLLNQQNVKDSLNK